MSALTTFRLALTLARREMRGGIRGFRVFIACLALGVAAIAGVGSLADGVTHGLRDDGRRLLYFTAVILIQMGIFSTRWNIVIGGQLFSKSFRGLMGYKMEILGIEGFLTALGLLVLPFIVLTVLIKVLPTRPLSEQAAAAV